MSQTIKGRIPALDGLRAISIALVILGHASATKFFPRLPFLDLMGDLGNLGVRFFYVISGFLITTLLIKESERSGRISLGGFYLRRVFRIVPALSVYLLALALLQSLNVLAISRQDWVHALTFTTNYSQHDRSWFVGHLWSLSVEEQFYLLWPAAMMLIGVTRSRWLAVGAVLLAPVCRTVSWILWPDSRTGIGETFPTVMDAIAIGCLLAAWRDKLANLTAYRAFLESRYFWAVPAVVVAANWADRYPGISLPLGTSIRNLGVGLLVHWSILQTSRGFTRVMESRPVRFVGVISYSLYLWQQLFFHRGSSAVVSMFPINVLAALGCAILSYILIESPARDLRERLERRRQGVMPRAVPIRG